MGYLDGDFQYDEPTDTSGNSGDFLNNPSYNYSDTGTTDNSNYSFNPDNYNWDNLDTNDIGTNNYSIPGGQYMGVGTTPLSGSAASGWDTAGGSVRSFLNDLFTKGSMPNQLGQLGTALASGYLANQKTSALQKAAAAADPWAGQRGYYQQQAQQLTSDPYSNPIIKNQLAQMQAIQDAKDAAAGRRSNPIMGNTAVLAQAAQLAANYQKQMAEQGGSNIGPGSAAQLSQSAANSGTNGYMQALSTLFGNQMQNNTNQSILNKIFGGSE